MSDWEKDLDDYLKTPEQKAADRSATHAAEEQARDRELRGHVVKALADVARRLADAARVIAKQDSRLGVSVRTGDRVGLSGPEHSMYVEPMNEGREIRWVVDDAEQARLVFDSRRRCFVGFLDPEVPIEIDRWTLAIVKDFVEIVRVG